LQLTLHVSGSGGTGKSYLVHRIVRLLEWRGRYVQVTATTGIAAFTIGGTTLHSWAGVGFGTTQKQLKSAWGNKVCFIKMYLKINSFLESMAGHRDTCN
jgi:hypothetical protein